MNSALHTQETLGERVKRYRKEREMPQAYLAELCGVTDGWISKIENDRYTPSPEIITKMAAAFKIPVHELLLEEDKRMELISRIKLIEVLLEVHQPDEAELYIFDLDTHPELTEKDKMTLLVHLAECRYQQKRYNETLALLQPLIDRLEADNYHDAEFLAKIRNINGKVYHQIQDYNNAFYNYRKAFDYTLRFTTQNKLAAHISFNVATTLLRRGNPEDALRYLQLAHNYYSNSNRLVDLAHTIYHQGISYKNSREFDKAADCFERAKILLEAQNELKQAVIVQQANASEVTVHENPDLAVDQLQKCMDVYRSLQEYHRLVHVNSKIAKIHLKQDQIEKAKVFLLDAEQLIQSHSLQDCGEIAEYYKIRSSFETRTQNHDQAIKFANLSYNFFGKMNALKDQIEVIEIIVDVYEQQGDFQSALLWEKKRSELYSILFEGKGML